MNTEEFCQQVSVIICSYNKFDKLKESVTSVLDHRYKVKEIIVVDDCSIESCINYMKKFFLEELESNFLVIKELDRNRGANYCRNLGASISSGSYIALLDDDDRWKSERLTSLQQYVKDDIKVVLCNYEEFNSSGYLDDKRYKLASGLINVEQLYFRNIYCGCSGLFICRSVFDDVKFDEELNVAQDWDYFVRISQRHKIYFVNQRLIDYRVDQEKSITKNYTVFSEQRYLNKIKATIKNKEIIGDKIYHRRLAHQIISGSTSNFDKLKQIKMALKYSTLDAILHVLFLKIKAKL